MHSNKQLILASKAFTKEFRLRSWLEASGTLLLLCTALACTFFPWPLPVRAVFSIATALFYVRMFVIYHDYQHHSILQHSAVARWIMKGAGIYLLAPQNVWKRSHDHHHNHNSKLTLSGIGSYPTISKEGYMKLTRNEQRLYLVNRHPLTIVFGYFTLFIYWLNVKSFFQSPKKHKDSLAALLFHFGAGTCVAIFGGATTFFISWFFPFLLAFAIGSYLFYVQHNFPSAQFRENHDWLYDHAALSSTSYMVMNPVMQWITGNIGFHHVHHLNARIPFYRLPEAMEKLPELHHVSRTSWKPAEVWRCFRLKLWDAEQGRMITLRQLRHSLQDDLSLQTSSLS
jgi:omega-6 fatty acid desaturase (delta-12 desaturase)